MIEDDFIEPEEGDYIISSCGHLGSDTLVSVVGGSSVVFKGAEHNGDVQTYILERMEEERFYPTVWMQSDHGNLEVCNIKEYT
jgi:hypothetical protein